MSGKIPQAFITSLLQRVDIVDLVDSRVPLKKTGVNFKACCPFHNEKSPSFTVNREKQFYYCFGCGAGGNAISFLMAYEHLDFVEAVEELAGFVGVDVPRESSAVERQDFQALYDLLHRVAEDYQGQLQGQEGAKACQYLDQRGVNSQMIDKFALGYAPDGWRHLANRFPIDALQQVGMLIKTDDGKAYDRFRDRLMFPIRNRRGRVIGFGGRVLGTGEPKYLNSPETPLFSKGYEVYGLYELLSSQPKPERILVVEGYLDVIALSQFGVDYSVATLGTAMTRMQIDLLFRYVKELVLCFDGDAAGQKAAWRAVQECLPALKDGRQVRVMLLPDGHDPDSLVRELGSEPFEELVLSSPLLSEYFFQHIAQGKDLTTVEGKMQLLNEGAPHLEKIPPGFFHDLMKKTLQEMGGDLLEIQLNPSKLSQEAPVFTPMKLTPERSLLALLLQKPERAQWIEDLEPNWSQLRFSSKAVLLDILQTIGQQRPQNTAVLLEWYRGSEFESLVFKMANLQVNSEGSHEFDEDAEFRAVLNRVLELGRKNYIEDQLNALVIHGVKDKTH